MYVLSVGSFFLGCWVDQQNALAMINLTQHSHLISIWSFNAGWNYMEPRWPWLATQDIKPVGWDFACSQHISESFQEAHHHVCEDRCCFQNHISWWYVWKTQYAIRQKEKSCIGIHGWLKRFENHGRSNRLSRVMVPKWHVARKLNLGNVWLFNCYFGFPPWENLNYDKQLSIELYVSLGIQ